MDLDVFGGKNYRCSIITKSHNFRCGPSPVSQKRNNANPLIWREGLRFELWLSGYTHGFDGNSGSCLAIFKSGGWVDAKVRRADENVSHFLLGQCEQINSC